ncbi:MAG: 2-phosphosulfolactate phosphatase [Elusimicrobia bacterium]|nr:2-phosphosulfolactate phosphatase [Elusimicrobiota bacterium]
MIVTARNAWEASPFPPEASVFIDVFRASTTLVYLLNAEVAEVLAVRDIELVRELVPRGYRLISEIMRDDLDNSPSQVLGQDLKGSRVILRTGNLTEAIFSNLDSFRHAYVACFANARETVSTVSRRGFGSVEMIACSHFSERREAVEDLSCAEMLRSSFLGKELWVPPFLDQIMRKVEQRKTRKEVFPEHYWRDIELALTCNSICLVPEISIESRDVISFQRAGRTQGISSAS